MGVFWFTPYKKKKLEDFPLQNKDYLVYTPQGS